MDEYDRPWYQRSRLWWAGEGVAGIVMPLLVLLWVTVIVAVVVRALLTWVT